MKKRVFITEFHQNNYAACAGRALLQRYRLTAFDTVPTAQEADVVIYLEHGYIGLTDLPRLITLMNVAKRAMHFIFCESDWPFPVLPGAYPSLATPYSWAHSWAFLPRLGRFGEELVGGAAPELLFSF